MTIFLVSCPEGSATGPVSVGPGRLEVELVAYKIKDLLGFQFRLFQIHQPTKVSAYFYKILSVLETSLVGFVPHQPVV